MQPTFIDLTGQTFGKLTVATRDPVNNRGAAVWICQCSCGKMKSVKSSCLRKGETKSCGCLRSENCTKLFANPRRKFKNINEKRRAYYLRNKTAISLAHKKRAIRNQEVIIKAKSVPCKDCGKQFYYPLMDFDHLPDFTKSYEISRMAQRLSVKKLQEEIAKCEIVCCLCHKIRTWIRSHAGQWPPKSL